MNEQVTKRREDCFFGLHSDFHAIPEDGLVIGATLEEEDIREICKCLKPDFVQVDCKGHPGWASYPTKMSNAMPNFKVDPLMLWRKITKEYGIGLYCHFSGVYDEKYCQEHPEDAVMDADGRYLDSVLPFSKYYDECFIPQISELVEKYDIDGIWIDGDCWSVGLDYRPETLAKFEKEFGIDLCGNVPKTSEAPYFYEYCEFTRELFRKSLRYYTDTLHKKYPKTILADVFTTPMDAKTYIAGMDILIGARMHATIAAFSTYVATIPFSYSRKFEGLYDSVGYDYVIHACSQTTDEAIEKTLEYIEKHTELSDEVKHSMEKIHIMQKEFESKFQEILAEI